MGLIYVEGNGNTVVGGISGSYCVVYNCINMGTVYAIDAMYVGGISGSNIYNYYASYHIINCVSLGRIITDGTTNYVGAFAGRMQGGRYNSQSSYIYFYVYNSYYGGECTITSYIGSSSYASTSGVSSCTTSDAKNQTWYTTTSNWYSTSTYGWDFNTAWTISSYANQGYPYLRNVGGQVPNSSSSWNSGGLLDTNFEGDGTSSNPYLITSENQLAGLSYLINYSLYNSTYATAYYKQTTDLDMSGYWWIPIGTSSYYFQGHYDGDGHTVSGLFTQYGTSTTYSYHGLFGYVRGASSTNRAEISNVGVIDSNIQGFNDIGGVVGNAIYTDIFNSYNTGRVTGSARIGGIAGYSSQSSQIYNCYNAGSLTVSGAIVGGIVGYNGYSSTINNSYNFGDVKSSYVGSKPYVGGVVGSNYNSTIKNCHNIGFVIGYRDVGGVVGYNNTSSTVSNTYNTGNIIGITSNSSYLGGIAGYNGASSVVTNSYNTGSVSGTSYVGGIIGSNNSICINSFNTGSVTGTSTYIGGIIGYNRSTSTISNCYFGGNYTGSYGIGSSTSSTSGTNSGTEQISSLDTVNYAKGISWYTATGDWDSSYPWDFETVWAFDGTNDGYPVLRELKTLKINIITSGIVTVSVDITTSGGGLSSDNILSTTTSENVITIDFINSNSNMNVYFAFNEEPTSESALNSATYAWDLTSGTLNVYAYQRRVVTYHSNDANNESVSYEYIGRETVTTLSNPFEVEEGYHFVNWNANSAGTGLYYSENSDITFYVLYDLDLYAQISGDVYNVVLNHGNGTSTTYYLKYGTGLYQNNPGDNSASAPLENIAPITRDGYTFHGYYTGENGTGEQIIDENGNVVGSPTFTLSPTTIYAYWTVNVPAYYDETGGYWYIEYGKMPQTKLDSTVEADRIIINALDGDSVLDDTDGVVASSNVYYFAGIALTAKVYNDEEYCNFRGNWYKVEPIRWRIAADENQATGNYFSSTSGFMAVMESVVYVGEYSETALSLNQGYLSVHGDESSSFSAVKYFLSNFNVDDSSYLVEFSANSQSYSSTGHVTESSNSTIFLSSKEEINNVCGGYATDFSDLAIDYLNSPYGDGQYYFVRDLGSNLNSVCSYTSGGGEIYNKPISVLGMRLTIKISEYICL